MICVTVESSSPRSQPCIHFQDASKCLVSPENLTYVLRLLQVGSDTAQRATSSASSRQGTTFVCSCAQTDGTAEREQCQVDLILGLSSPAVGLASQDTKGVASWHECFALLGKVIGQKPGLQYAGAGGSDVVSCAQRCSGMAQDLRSALTGLPVSSLGAATACLIAKAASVLANRQISKEASLLYSSVLLQASLGWTIHTIAKSMTVVICTLRHLLGRM